MLHKFIKIIPFLFIAVSSYAQQQSYTINGTIDPLYDGKKVYITKLNERKNELISIDSTLVNNGTFTYTNYNPSDKRVLFISADRKAPLLFIPEAGVIEAVIGDTMKVGGTPLNNNYQRLIDNENLLMQALYDAYNNTYENPQDPSIDFGKNSPIAKPFTEKIAKNRFNFAQKNIDSELGEYITLISHSILEPSQILELISEMRPDFKNSALGQEAISYYTAESKVESGKPFKDIKMYDPLGNEVQLSDYVGKNKVVLVDFWASWCGPCVKEMPMIAEAYKKYKSKGLEIVGISLDQNKESWLRGIERFDISWPQMSDLKQWESDVVSTYGIRSIPFTLLLDENGTIIASGLRGHDLIRKLSLLLD